MKAIQDGGDGTIKDTKAQYGEWIKKLGKAYLTLLRSPEHSKVLGETVKALHGFRVSQKQLLIDMS